MINIHWLPWGLFLFVAILATTVTVQVYFRRHCRYRLFFFWLGVVSLLQSLTYLVMQYMWIIQNHPSDLTDAEYFGWLIHDVNAAAFYLILHALCLREITRFGQPNHAAGFESLSSASPNSQTTKEVTDGTDP
jgi:hypothetical protein